MRSVLFGLFLILGWWNIGHAAALSEAAVLSFQGQSLGNLTAKMPKDIASSLLLHFKINILAYDVSGMQKADSQTLKTCILSKVIPVGTDVGEEELIQQQGQYKVLLQQHACVLALLPPDLNFNENIVSWANYILCLTPEVGMS